MAASHADNVTGLFAASTTATVTFPNAVGSGDMLCAIIRAGAGAAITVSDNINGSWTTVQVGATPIFGAYFLNSAAAGANGLIITITGASGVIRVSADRFTGGTYTFVASANHQSQSVTTGDDGTITGDLGGNLLYGGFGTGTNAVTSMTPGSSNGVASVTGGFLSSTVGNNLGTIYSQYVLSTAAGSQTMAWTASAALTSVNAIEMTFSFVAAAVPAVGMVVGAQLPGRRRGATRMREPQFWAQSIWPAPAPAADAAITVPRVGSNGIVSYRPWRETNWPNRDGWYDPMAMQGTTVGKLNVDADMAMLDTVMTGKVKRLRFEIPWRWIETAKGVYDWSHLDYQISAMQRRNITAHAIVVFTPTWAGGTPQTLPAAADFSSFITALVSRYKRWGTYNGINWGVRIWEMWNEPDLTNYSTFTVAQYVANILNPGYTAAKAADPNCLVSCAGPANKTAAWANGLSAGGLTADVVGFHDYPGSAAGVNSDYAAWVSLLTGAAPTAINLPVWLDEWGVLDTTGATEVSWENTIFPANAQSPASASNCRYTFRDDNNTTGASTLATALTNGTPVTSLTMSGSVANMASGDPFMLFWQAGDGVIHQIYGTVNGAYSGGTTLTVNSLTPNYSYPIGTQVQSIVPARAPQAYGIWDRSGAAKGSAVTTFASYLQNSSGIGYTRTTTDTATATDVASRIASFPRATADTAAATDATVRLVSAIRAIADTAAATDATSRLAAFARVAAEASSAVDSATRIATAIRATANTATVADTTSRIVNALRATNDAGAASDAASRAYTGVRGSTDTAAATDSLSRIITAVRGSADTAAATDAAVGVKSSGARIATDTATASDATDRIASYVRNLSDTAVAADTASRITTTGGAAADAATTTDVASRSAAYVRASAENSGATDAVSRLVTYVRNSADTATTSDAASKVTTIVRVATDAAAISDVLTRQYSAPRATADVVAAADAVGRTITTGRSSVDVAGISDVASRISASSRALADAAAASDALTRVTASLRTTVDIASANEMASRVVTSGRSTTDAAGASDVVTRQYAAIKGAADTAGATEVIARTWAAHRSSLDTATAVDSAFHGNPPNIRGTADTATAGLALSRIVAAGRAIADAAGAAEAASRALGTARSVSDTAGAMDGATRAYGAARAVGDAAAASEAASRVSNVFRGVAEAAAIADALLRSTTAVRVATDLGSALDAASRFYSGSRGTSDVAVAMDAAGGFNASKVIVSLTLGSRPSSRATVGVAGGGTSTSSSPSSRATASTGRQS